MAPRESSLYGGAITANLPADFMDAGTVRDIPDTQEVHLSRTGLASIVFDILERVEAPVYAIVSEGEAGDYEALKFHLDDVVSGAGARTEDGEDEEEAKVLRTEKIVLPRLGSDVPAYSLLATITPVTDPIASQQAGGKAVPQFTAEILTLIRLVEKRTDILISVNVPHVQGEYDPEGSGVDFSKGEEGLGRMVQEGKDWMREIVETFTIVDWDLFDG